MDLTDEQWALVAPLLQDVTPPASVLGGRPPLPDRLILDAILWKIRTRSPWTAISARRQGGAHSDAVRLSHQTCYRRYQYWQHPHLWDQILSVLYADMRQRGRLDPLDLLASFPKALLLDHTAWTVTFAQEPELSWQGSIALVFIALAIERASRRRSEVLR